MPFVSVHVPLYDKLPDELFGGAFKLWLAPGGEKETGRAFGYYFHDRTWWADAAHLTGFAREILHCHKYDNLISKLLNTRGGAPKPNWLCGHGYQLQDNGKYLLSGTRSVVSVEALLSYAQSAVDALGKADITRDQWACNEHAQWLSAIQVHMTQGLQGLNPWIAEHIVQNGALDAYIRHKNHADAIHHPVYPISGPRNASGIGQTHCNSLLNADFQSSAYTGPATIYSALFSVVPSDTGVGTEAAYSGYARQTITCNSSNFPAASAGAITYGVVIGFPTNTGSSETEVATSWMAASSGGAQPLYWGNLSSNVTVSNGIAPQFNANAVTTSGV